MLLPVHHYHTVSIFILEFMVKWQAENTSLITVMLKEIHSYFNGIRKEQVQCHHYLTLSIIKLGFI